MRKPVSVKVRVAQKNLSLHHLDAFIRAHPLTRHRRLQAWSRVLWWQLQSRVQQEVTVPWIGGLRFIARRGMTGFTGNIYAGLHEAPDMLFLLHFLRKDDLFFDIGANVGSYSLLAAGIAGAQVWAFEPDPDNATHMERIVDLNNLGAKVRIRRTALGDVDGEVAFSVGLDTVNHVAQSDESNTRTVAVARLDSLTGGVQPVMLKIDVEGYEDHVLDGAMETLASPSLQAILIETVTESGDAMLRRAGFAAVSYDHASRTIADASPTSRARSANSLYLRDLAFVQDRLAGSGEIEINGVKT